MRSEWAEDPAVEGWRKLVEMKLNAARVEDLGGLYEKVTVTREDLGLPPVEPDPVHMPSHYTQLPVEAIDITEHFNFCMGNALKYLWRADHKGKPLEDLRKARWYIDREIARRERDGG